MPFLTLNNNWSNLSKYYNQSFNNKPEVPRLKYTAFDDGLIRGGVINATLASVRDTARIGNFLASGKGVLFITKQVGLQLSNPLLEQEAPQDTFGKLGTNTKSNLLNKAAGLVNKTTTALNSFINQRTPNQLYNLGLNTLTQIPLNAFGGHIIRQGKLPIGGGGYLNGSTDNIKGYNYEKITKENNRIANNQVNSTYTATSNDNIPPATTNIVGQGETGKIIYNQGGKLITQYSSARELKANLGSKSKTIGFSKERPRILEEVTVETKGTRVDLYQNSSNRLLSYYGKIAKFGKSGGTIELLTYNGGPESAYGIGKTSIKTYPDQQTDITKKISDKSAPDKDDASKLLNGFQARSYNTVINRKTNINRFNSTYIPTSTSFNIEDRIGVSKIGGDQNINNKTVDSINVISIMDSKTFYDNSMSAKKSNVDVPNLLSDNKDVSGNFGRDIIKFRIEFLNNDTNVPDVLAFRAYIDDFNDGMTARWNSYRYMGRGEDFYIYDGFTRDINVAFTVYAHSPAEMKPLYQKLNYLMSTFAPDYNSANKMRGNIGYLTVGDYIYRQPGIFNDIKLSGMLDTHWEIALNDPEEGSDIGQYEIPKHIKINLSFKPIHNFLPRRATAYTLDKTPFITPNSALIGKGGLKNKYLYNPEPKKA